ncbi:protein of unknown function [Microbacterium sp. Nx66]|nr:protein of unknown function [Microbacterium sp. Nx66]
MDPRTGAAAGGDDPAGGPSHPLTPPSREDSPRHAPRLHGAAGPPPLPLTYGRAGAEWGSDRARRRAPVDAVSPALLAWPLPVQRR